MSEHTPGPWHVRAPTDVMHAVCRLSGSIIADVGYSNTLEENDANGRLISAAPDLLEALILLEHEMIESGNAWSKDYGWTPAIEKTRAAIAKATGKQ